MGRASTGRGVASCALIIPSRFVTRNDALSSSQVFEAHPKAVSHLDQFGRLPLHYACAGRAPLETVKLLLEAHPEGVAVVEGMDQMSPLHLAFRARAPEAVTDALMAADDVGERRRR